MGQLLEAASVEVGELVVIESEEPQDRDMQVAHRMDDFDGPVSHLVRGSDDGAARCSSAGQHHGHGVGIVSAAVGVDVAAAVVVRRAAELARADDERFIEHAASFEVFDERRDWLVDALDSGGVVAFEEVVTVPATGEHLNEAYSFFD